MFLFVFCYTPTFCRDGLELGQKQMCRNTAAFMAAAEENVTFLRRQPPLPCPCPSRIWLCESVCMVI